MKKWTVLVLSLLIAALCALPANAQAEDDSSEVTFVHGIRGFFADVYLDDKLILAGFAPERITEPLTLQPGSHRIDLRAADAEPESEPDVTKQFDVPAGSRLTAIAHWTGVEDCTISLFDEGGDVVAAGSGKLIARHAAATGDVEFALDGKTVGLPLRPANQVAESVAPGAHTIAVNDRDTSSAIITGSQVPVPEGSARVVYLVGSAKDKSLALLTQVVSGVGSSPDGVPTGNSGLAATNRQTPYLPLLAIATICTALLMQRRREWVRARG